MKKFKGKVSEINDEKWMVEEMLVIRLELLEE